MVLPMLSGSQATQALWCPGGLCRLHASVLQISMQSGWAATKTDLVRARTGVIK